MQRFLLAISRLLAAGDAGEKVNEILKTMAGPIFAVLGGAGAIYVIILGVSYAKSEDDGKKKEMKKRIFNLVIGIIAMFALATICLAIQWEPFIESLLGYAWEDL